MYVRFTLITRFTFTTMQVNVGNVANMEIFIINFFLFVSAFIATSLRARLSIADCRKHVCSVDMIPLCD